MENLPSLHLMSPLGTSLTSFIFGARAFIQLAITLILENKNVTLRQIAAQKRSVSELLLTLSRVAASRQSCLCTLTFFITERSFRALAGCLTSQPHQV